MSCVRSFWAHEPVGEPARGPRIAMRPGEARPGQRVGLLATDTQTRLEGFFIFEEGEEAVLATSYEPFRADHPEEGVTLSRPDGDDLEFFFISVAIANVLVRVPSSWGEDFVPALPGDRQPPSISQLMGAFHSRSTAVPSEAEESADPTPPHEGSAAQRAAGSRQGPTVGRGGRSVGFAPTGRSPATIPATMAGAGLGRRQTERLAALYDESEEEDDAGSSDPQIKTKSASRAQTSYEDELMMRLVKGGGQIDPQALASLEMLKLIREMREDERRRRMEETDDSDLFSPSRSASGLGRAIAGMTRHRARIKEYPRKVIDEFRQDSMLELNVRPGESWAFPDLAKRISWGHFQGLQRCYILFANILELLEQGQPLQAQALTVQSMKATHQCVLNNGNWKLGWPLTGIQDPLTRRKFAGSATELELMANFVQAEEEVEKKSKGSASSGSQQQNDGGHDNLDDEARAARRAAAKAKASAAKAKKKGEQGA